MRGILIDYNLNIIYVKLYIYFLYYPKVSAYENSMYYTFKINI